MVLCTIRVGVYHADEGDVRRAYGSGHLQVLSRGGEVADATPLKDAVEDRAAEVREPGEGVGKF